MLRDDVVNAYFEWMYDLVCGNRYAKEISFRKLLMQLHSTRFRYIIPKDANRAEDGISLRYRFAYDTGCACADSHLEGPCSVLEMMIAVSFKLEEIMDDPKIGDRTSQWFWMMIMNLGLGSMTDDNFDRDYVTSCIERFMKREYRPDGEGGLFVVRNCGDLRRVEIWYQMCWYLDSIT